MTAQFPDYCWFEGREYEIAGIEGEPLFEPTAWGIEGAPVISACWRGYVAHYRVERERLLLDSLEVTVGDWEPESRQFAARPGPPLNGVSPVKPSPDESIFDSLYESLALPIPFTGGLLLADDFIEDLYVHMGFHPAWKYRTVHELRFEQGHLVAHEEISEQMAAIREEQRGSGSDRWQ